MDLCRNALRTLGASLIIGLGFFSGALAQSGNPIRIGMSLALTGAGASPLARSVQITFSQAGNRVSSCNGGSTHEPSPEILDCRGGA
jgi:hypothetical protein